MKLKHTLFTFAIFCVLFLTLIVEFSIISEPSETLILSKKAFVATVGLPDLALFSHSMRHRSLQDKFSQNPLDVALLSQDRALFVVQDGVDCE